MAKKIGPYEIVSELGRGGMGVVYKAREESLQRYVAIKMLGNQLVDDDAVSERFMREARVVADLNHPNLVQVFRVDRHEDQPYFVMEYVEGDSLKALIQRERRMQPIRALQILQEVASGLAAAHDKGVVHRDIKPENIMLTKYGGVKVVDFGIARDENAETRLTTTGIGLGTPSYLSPEVCLSHDVDQRSDIFSLGVVLFEMLTGDIPFKSDSPFEMMTKVVEAKVPDIKELNPNVDEGIKKILAKMIAKRPKLRYQHCNELISDIEDYRAGREPRWAKDVVLDEAVETTGPTSVSADTPTDVMPAATPAAGPPTARTASPTAATEAFETSGGTGKGFAVAALFLLLVLSGAAASTWYLLAGSDRPLLAWFGGEDDPTAAFIETDAVRPAAIDAAALHSPAAVPSEPSPSSTVDPVSTSGGYDDESASPGSLDGSAPQTRWTGSAAPGSDAAERAVTAADPSSALSTDPSIDPSTDPSTGALGPSSGESAGRSAEAGAGFRFAVEPSADPPSAETVSGASSSPAPGAGSNPASSSAESLRTDPAQRIAAASDDPSDEAVEASEQPPAELSSPTVDPADAVASVIPLAASRTEAASGWNPAAPRIVVVAAGDPAVAAAIEEELERALNRASFEVMDEQLMDGMGYAETLPDIARAALDEGADILVFADVVPAGERELNFYGRTDFQYLANLQVRVVVLHERRNLGPMLRERLEYVGLNADEKARQVSQSVVRDVLSRLRALRAGAATAAG